MTNVALLTVTHDPNAKNLKLMNQLKKEIEHIYGEVFIAISDKSSIEYIKELKNSNFNVKIIPKKGAAEARREVVKFGLGGESEFFHYCDFDRLLTWGENYLEELKRTVSTKHDEDYLILGRTERAMQTHPIEWIETETITNKIVSMELGQKVDVTAGSCMFTRRAATYINTYSKEKMTDAEWAMIIHRIAKLNIGYTAVEGLEYHEAINGIIGNQSSSEKWLARLRLSYIISETAIHVGK
ncbi:hypothetical protein [Bacillus suaedae]|uniref:Uncharacterized protein n=1 Tax=Halalkalibacter suaedae TaxID=2822140 RepID=A0A941AMN0_9BACI|nr:hypothetical protein [Bacillus suaedae]MBP3950710.1 hypothetical protein [Bacillus suaedae]